MRTPDELREQIIAVIDEWANDRGPGTLVDRLVSALAAPPQTARGQEPNPQLDPQWQCSGCANWWPGWMRLCDMCGKTFWGAKIVRGDCDHASPVPAVVATPDPQTARDCDECGLSWTGPYTDCPGCLAAGAMKALSERPQTAIREQVEQLPHYVAMRDGELRQVGAWPDSLEVVVKLADVLALCAETPQGETK